MSAKPPAFAIHKSPILWEQSWQKYLDELYTKNPESIQKLSVLESTPDSAIQTVFKDNHAALCDLQRRIFNFAADRCTEDDFDRKWRAAGPEVQEKCYFDAMKRIAAVPGMETQREFTPEITLRNFHANHGWGYLDLLRSLLPDRLVVNEYIRVPHPVLDAKRGIEGPFDTSELFPTDRDLLVHKTIDVVRCTFISMAVWFTLRSFYNIPGDFTLLPTEKAANTSSDGAQEANGMKTKQVLHQVKPICANCKKRASDYPKLTFKSCIKCKDTPTSVMYCSRECQVSDWKYGDPPHKAVCGKPRPRSAALLKQIALLEKHPSVDYFLMRPEPLPEVGVTFGAVDPGKIFRRVRELAFERGDRTAVGLMYSLLGPEVRSTARVVELDRQITEEFGFSVEELRAELGVINGVLHKLGESPL